MPSFITHHVFGHEALKKCSDSDILRIIRENQSAFNWGLQGPDLLFFRKALSGKSTLHPYGNMMHADRDVGGLLNGMKKYIDGVKDKSQRETLLSYFYGFICHYCLDSTAHPYVYAMQERETAKKPGANPSSVHGRIESDIDSAIYPLFSGGARATTFDLIQYAYTEDMASLIESLYRSVLLKRYGINVPKREIVASFKDANFLERLLIDKTGIVYPVVDFIEGILKKRGKFTSNIRTKEPFDRDALNLNQKIWRSPWHKNEQNALSFLDLFDSAKLCAEKLLCTKDPYPDGLVSFDNGNPRELENTV